MGSPSCKPTNDGIEVQCMFRKSSSKLLDLMCLTENLPEAPSASHWHIRTLRSVSAGWRVDLRHCANVEGVASTNSMEGFVCSTETYILDICQFLCLCFCFSTTSVVLKKYSLQLFCPISILFSTTVHFFVLWDLKCCNYFHWLFRSVFVLFGMSSKLW